MMSPSAPALRPMLPSDAPLLAAIFRASVVGLTGEDYSPAQQDAWMSGADDEGAFAARRAQELTLVATINREPVGFASLKGPDHVEMLFVHPGAARKGVATALIDALETLAAARGTTRLTSPITKACCALMVSPVRSSSMARRGPMTRG